MPFPSIYAPNCLTFSFHIQYGSGFSGGSGVKNLPANAGDMGSIPGSVRGPEEGNGNPLQYSCLENPKHRGAWWAKVHRVAKSWIRLSAQAQYTL